METWLERATVFSGPIFEVISGTVRLDDGRSARRDVVVHGGGAAIVPVLGSEVLLVRQFRVALGREMLEVPAGRFEPNETPEQAAARELQEELGYRPGRLIPLTTYYASVGYTTERTAIFLALDLQPAPGQPDWDERLQTVAQPLADLPAALANGTFEDAKTVIGLYAALAWLQHQA